jgi:hypothetical protein
VNLDPDDLEPRPPPALRSLSQRDPRDRDWAAAFEWTPELLVEYAQQAQAVLDHLYGDGGSPTEPIDQGDCQDCHRERALRKYGNVYVCSECASLRRRAASRAAEPIVRQEVTLTPKPPRIVIG